jgi:chaperonin GroEL
MSRAYDNEQTLQQKIMNGANILADNVASTLGPRGRNVLLKEKGGVPFVTKDGVTVAAFVSLEDPFEDAAAQIIKQAAVETNNNAGDGTTTATVLARSIICEAQRYIASGMSPVEIQRGIHLATKTIIDNLKDMATPIKSIDDIRHIATISANNDGTIGELISLAIDRIGQDGAITIEESRSMDTSIDIIEGFKFDSGYVAGAFITDERRAILYHEEPLFMVTDHKVSNVEQILPVLELCARESRPLIIVAEEIEGQALAALIMNAMRGTLKVAAIKAPSYGEERRNTLEDIAASTGAKFLSRESGTKLQETQMMDLGTAKFIESTKYTTTIVGGQQDYEAIESRIMNLKAVIEQTESLEECEAIQGRITRLNSGVAVIRVGGSTEVEMTEKKHRIEDALEAVRAAQEEGVVAGGGTALARAAQSMVITTKGDTDEFHPDQTSGINIVMAACQEPLRQMARNSGESPDLVLAEVLGTKAPHGWDFRRGGIVNLIEKGIIDPVKVTRIALQNAASCAGTLLTTNFGIIQREDD